MSAKLTVSLAEDTIAQARACAQREGVSLSTWFNRAAQEQALREVFNAHAAAIHRAGLDDVSDALADEAEAVAVHEATFGGSWRATR